jgi:hypothetical protein
VRVSSSVDDVLTWLQGWYGDHCDGDWEHQYGVELGTIDNPGWRLRVDLVGTELEGRTAERTAVDRSSSDWMQTWVQDDCFHAAGGPNNLADMIGAFRHWVEDSRP